LDYVFSKNSFFPGKHEVVTLRLHKEALYSFTAQLNASIINYCCTVFIVNSNIHFYAQVNDFLSFIHLSVLTMIL